MNAVGPDPGWTCGRCGHPVRPGVRRWPEGRICWGCFTTAMETYATCARCGVHRLAPGLSPDGQPLCPQCAGITVGFVCTTCGCEARRYIKNTCGHCVLSARLAALLDDGTGQVRPELVPFYDAVRAMDRPRTGILWISKPHVRPILTALARGQVPLTHDGLSTLDPWRSVIHVRDLLIGSGVLPPADRFLLLFEQWLSTWLAAISDDTHRTLLRQFAAWHTLRRLRDAASTGPVGYARNQAARHRLVQSAAFLQWLATRDRDLSQCTQAEDTQLELRDRIVALLILLYAQPITKITALTTSDVIRDGATVQIRLGEPPAPVPEPFAALLTSYLTTRPNLATATNPDSSLLFPGRRAGQPMHPTTLRLRLAAADIPNITSRTAALRELLLQAPAPVVARMLGYSTTRAEHLAAAAGSTWKTYAPADHDAGSHRNEQPQRCPDL